MRELHQMRLLLCNFLTWVWPTMHRNQWHDSHNFTKIYKIVRTHSNLRCSLRPSQFFDFHSSIRNIGTEPRCSLFAQVVLQLFVATTTIPRAQSCDCARGSRQGTFRSNLLSFRNEEKLTLELEPSPVYLPDLIHKLYFPPASLPLMILVAITAR